MPCAGSSSPSPACRPCAAWTSTCAPAKCWRLLGENGAGKSTLIKVLGGAVVPDAGTHPASTARRCRIRRARRRPPGRRRGHLPGVQPRPGADGGREHLPRPGATRLAGSPRGDERRRAAELFRRLGVADRSRRAVPRADASPSSRRSRSPRRWPLDARILVMDEPTATLTPPEVERLFAIIRDLKRHGARHHLHQPSARRDLRHRRPRHGAARRRSTSATRPIARGRPRRADRDDGRPAARPGVPAAARRPIGEPRLVVTRPAPRAQGARRLVRRSAAAKSLGLTGLVGSGRTETARLIFGADRARRRHDRARRPAAGHPLAARRHPRRHRLLTEDRKGQGLVLAHSVRDNFALPNLAALSRLGFVDRRRGARRVRPATSTASASAWPTPEQPARNLSGGNQQKVVLAKWLRAQLRGGHLRRADARHRRRGEVRDLPADQRAGRAGARRS